MDLDRKEKKESFFLEQDCLSTKEMSSIEKVKAWLARHIPTEEVLYIDYHHTQTLLPKERVHRYEVYKKRMKTIGEELKQLDTCALHKTVGTIFIINIIIIIFFKF